MDQRPLLIVVSIVRNEAWILDAFLSAASLWADMIVIADQMSTDGSREIYKRYPKVHVIDNDRPNMHQSASRKLALNEVRRLLNGNTNAVLLAMDADEILEGDFIYSKAWGQIVNSTPNDCFEWSWMNVGATNPSLYSVSTPLYWGVHVSDDVWNGIFPESNIHEMRLPWPNSDAREIILRDFYSIHFGYFNIKRVKNKSRFYQVSSLDDATRYNVVNLYRQYHTITKAKSFPVPNDAYIYYQRNGLDIISMIDLEDEGAYYTEEIKKYFERYGTKKYAMLDIWDEEWCEKNGVDIPKRDILQKIVMWYLKKSNPYVNTVLVRAIDKMLKILYK